MSWSFKIARIAGIDVKIHVTFFLLLAWIGLTYYRIGGTPAAIEGLVFILALFGCVLLHEFGHAIAARMFGVHTPDITLLPIGGVARLQRMPDKPSQELIVALAGPLVNVVIAGAIIAYLGYTTDLSHITELGEPRAGTLAKLATVNIWLVLFNLIPAFPMDGGRVLRSVLAMTMNYARATQIAAWIGQALAFVFGFIGLFSNPMLIFIALFVYLGAQQEAAAAQMKEISLNLSVADAMVTQFTPLPATATLDDATEALLRTSEHEFPVLDDTGRVLGVLTRDRMIEALKRSGPATLVTSVMRTDLPTVGPNERFDEAFRRMQEAASPALPVVDPSGRLLGLVTPENVGELMLVQSIRPHDGRPAWRRPAVARSSVVP